MRKWHKSYPAYLFDLDGTLIDTVPDINVALNHSLIQAGFQEVREDHTRHWIGHGARTLLKEALLHQRYQGDLEERLDLLLPQFLEFYSDHHADLSQPYPEVEETLATLQARGAKLAVVTNKLTYLSTQILDSLKLTPFFDAIVCGDTAAHPKPDPAPVLFCLEKLGVSPLDALFVGDSITDVSAARAAGTPVVCVRDGYNHGQDVSQLDLDGVILSFSELL